MNEDYYIDSDDLNCKACGFLIKPFFMRYKKRIDTQFFVETIIELQRAADKTKNKDFGYGIKMAIYALGHHIKKY